MAVNSTAAIEKEFRLRGTAVSRGTAAGKIVCLYGDRRQFFRANIPDQDIDAEVQRLTTAVASANDAIKSDIAAVSKSEGSAISEILETHLLTLQDRSLLEKLFDSIRVEKVNAEWAVQTAIDEFSSRLRNISDNNLREKYLDVEDIGDRVLTALGAGSQSIELPRQAIVAAKEIRPSMLLQLIARGVVGIVTESGGWTSHTSILARESKIPAVSGLTQIFSVLQNGHSIVVDGNTGEIILNPSETTTAVFRPSSKPTVERSAYVSEPKDALRTSDGREIILRTNTTSAGSYAAAEAGGAKGIGLFRSESLITIPNQIPNEETQYEAYLKIANACGEHGVRIRTFDIDADQIQDRPMGRQKNPALGLRAVRLGLIHRELLRPQLRAILRASHFANINLIVPMVAGVSELREIRELISSESKTLRSEGTPFSNPPIGAMVEIPSAVLVVEQIAREADFLCLGTNDLAQYLLATDRDNESVSKWFRTLHPAMIRAVKKVIDACSNSGKPLTVCGEMAGSPFYVPVLIGLGTTDLSINPGSIESVSRVIAGISYEEAAELVSKIEEFATADEIENAVETAARTKWSHLFAPGFLDTQNPNKRPV